MLDAAGCLSFARAFIILSLFLELHCAFMRNDDGEQCETVFISCSLNLFVLNFFVQQYVNSFIRFLSAVICAAFLFGVSLSAQTPTTTTDAPPIKKPAKPSIAPQGEIPNPSTANDIPSETVKDKTDAEVSSPVPLAGENNFELVDATTRKDAVINMVRCDVAPVIDGRLDDECWTNASRLTNFYQTQPGDNTAPSKPSVAYFAFDAKHFYIGFRAFDEPSKIRATIAKRDNVFGEDNIRIYLDTFNDGRRAYLLGFNPLGIQADAIHTEGRGSDFSVDIVMDSRGVIDDKGYTVEAAIPFKSLRYEAGKGKFWRFHIQREINRLNDERSSYMPISRDLAGLLNQAGRLTGLEGIATERTIEIIPGLILSETGKRVALLPPCGLGNQALCPVDEGRFVNERIKGDPSLTAKFGITPTVVLDVAVNPDFAQVEADQQVVLANQRFPIFFPERRPFFLEGIDIFQTRMNVINTRSIVDPDYAVKLTGKRGRNTFGFIAAADANPPAERSFSPNKSSVGILRLKRDIGDKDSNLGMFATSYKYRQTSNQLAGFDGRFRLDNQTVAEFQLTGTTARNRFFNPFADLISNENVQRTGNGFGYSYNLDKTGRNFGYTLNGVGRTRDYRADVGFTPRTNTNQHRFAVRFSNDPDAKRQIISYRLTSQFITSHDFQLRAQNHQNNTELTLNLQRNTYAGAGFEAGYEKLFEFEFGRARNSLRFDDNRRFDDGGNLQSPRDFTGGAFFGAPERSAYNFSPFLFFGSSPTQKLRGEIVFAPTFNAFDFDFGASRRYPRVSPAALANPNAPLDPGTGFNLFIESEIEYQPTSELSVSLDYTKSRLRRRDTKRIAFDDNIFSLRSAYRFTPYTFIRARVDYSSLSTRVTSQLLLGYTPNPGTAFYAGYNDDTRRNAFSPFSNQLEPGLRRNGRTFFIKAAYLFRRSIG